MAVAPKAIPTTPLQIDSYLSLPSGLNSHFFHKFTEPLDLVMM